MDNSTKGLMWVCILMMSFAFIMIVFSIINNYDFKSDCANVDGKIQHEYNKVCISNQTGQVMFSE